MLSSEERAALERYARRGTVAQQLGLRARIVLRCAAGFDNKTVAHELRVWPAIVGKWRGRFIARRLEGLLDEPRPGAPRKISDEQVEQVVTRTLETTPKGATHWSTRQMGQADGHQPDDGQPHLACLWPAPASQRKLQTLDRSATGGEGA